MVLYLIIWKTAGSTGKVYEYYLQENGKIGERYFKWAKAGWDKIAADRYPMGKGAKPLYSYWDGKTYSYIKARKKIYIPLYYKAVKDTFAFKKLKELYLECLDKNEILYLRDFDAHNLEPGTYEYEDLWNNDQIKVGHAYVLAMMLENKIENI